MQFSESISVISAYDSKTGQTTPHKLVWRNREYIIDKVGLYHCYRVGRNLVHVFSLVSGDLFLRVSLDSENLRWKLEELGDSF